MKIAAIVARVLLGLAFIVFGLDAFLNVIPKKPEMMPTGHALDFSMALMASHYMQGIAAVELVGAILLLISGRLAPLGLLFIGPVVVNIAFYHLFLDHNNAGPAVVVAVLSLFLLYYYRSAFADLVRVR